MSGGGDVKRWPGGLTIRIPLGRHRWLLTNAGWRRDLRYLSIQVVPRYVPASQETQT